MTPKVVTALGEAANEIVLEPEDRWVGWIIYLLEALEDNIDRSEYESMLSSIQADIQNRLELGCW